MSEILTSKASPRYENNTWKWYIGDTFHLIFKITLKDASGNNLLTDPSAFDISNTASMLFEFFDKKDKSVHKFTFPATGSNLRSYIRPLPQTTSTSNYLHFDLDFDTDVTKKFGVGRYNFCITYFGDEVTTIFANGEVEVELCH